MEGMRSLPSFLCPSAFLTTGSNLLSAGGSQSPSGCTEGENTDPTPQSLGWLRSRSPWFSTNWLPWLLDPPRGNYTVGILRHSGTSSRCPCTRTGPLHYSRCSWGLPAQTWPSDTLAGWPEDLRQRQKRSKTETWIWHERKKKGTVRALVIAVNVCRRLWYAKSRNY